MDRSDDDLMQAVRGGDLDAFGLLVRRHQASAWNAAWRFLGDRAEAEDVAQEAFLRILEAAARWTPAASFRTYLHRVVTRLCVDRARRRRPIYTDATPGAARPGPGDPERDAAVRRALDGLEPRQRMAVVLRHYEGAGYRDIAAALEITEKAAERLLARAREALEEALAPVLERAKVTS